MTFNFNIHSITPIEEGGGGEVKNQNKTITENGVYTADSGYTGLGVVTVNVEGSGEVDHGGDYLVQVLDYDGKVLKSDHLNTGDIFTLPDEPSNDRLIFQEWSTPVVITDNKITVGHSDITIGAIYTTKSGMSEFDISLNVITGKTITMNTNSQKDWGDGTVDSATSHTYANYGDYTIKIGYYSPSQNTLFPTTGNYFLKKVFYLGSSSTSNNFRGWQKSYNLEVVCIDKRLTQTTESAFQDCYSLKHVAFPNGTTTIHTSLLECYTLKSVVLPEGITNIVSTAMNNCYSLTSILIPSTVTTISGCFQNLYNVKVYDFTKFSSVPTLSASNTFNKINAFCKILVPASLEMQWKTATNWATYSNYIMGV